MILHPVSALASVAFAAVTALPILCTEPRFALYVETVDGLISIEEHDASADDCDAAQSAWRAFPDVKRAWCAPQGS